MGTTATPDLHSLEPVGYCALMMEFNPSALPHYRSSYIARQGRRKVIKNQQREVHIYSKAYALPSNATALHQLEFALKHDGINLEIFSVLLEHLSASDIQQFILQKPTGKYRRMIWFLYEFLTKQRLDIPDLKNTPYVNLLDPKRYYCGTPIKSKRHAINNNLLGNNIFCPFVRRTKALLEFEQLQLDVAAKKMTQSIDPAILARASQYMYTKETQSSFNIEHINPDKKKTASFINLLKNAWKISELNKTNLIELQNIIVDKQCANQDYRSSQNYVGELMRDYRQKIHYISPKPDDLEQLMSHFYQVEKSLVTTDINPVIIASILSFAFVFFHPFDDGNGRLHRFIIHYILDKLNFTPNNLIFPISSIILKNRRAYDAALELFSEPLLSQINHFTLNEDGVLSVKQATKVHYQFIDFTHQAEYIFECINHTIEQDFQDEIDFIIRYDRTKLAIQAIISMPDDKIDRLIRCVSQNNGKLGKKNRRRLFQELDDALVANIETVIKREMLE